jgi:zinc protease
VRFPPFQDVTLPNGLTLVVIENHEQPTVSMSLTFRAGAMHDPAGKEGLAEIVAELLTKGTPSRSAEQIAATIEGVGGALTAGVDRDFLTVSADGLAEHVDLTFALLVDVVRRASFPDAELELARTRFLSTLQLQLSTPEGLADRAFARELYGRHPYGRRASAASYRAITRDDARGFAAARLRPRGALLVVAGDVTPARVRSLVDRSFTGWTGGPPATAPVAAPPSRTTTDIVLVHRPGSVQSNVVVGNTTFLPTDSGFYAARLATHVLGGGPDSRLFLILREQKSWTYGAYAGLERYRGLGYWQATAETRTAVTDSALVELLRQVDRMRTEVVPDSELAHAKGFLVGSFPLTIETPSQVASQVANAKRLGLGSDYLRTYRDRLNGVTATQARTAARRILRRDALSIVVVGDGAKVYEPLKAIAAVRIVDAEGDPIAPEDLSPKAGAPTLDRAQIVSRSDSLRVVVQGNAIGGSLSTTLVTADSIVVTEQSSVMGFGQQTTVVLEGRDLSMRRTDQVTQAGAQRAEVHLKYAAGRVSGTGAALQPGGAAKTYTVDTALAGGTYDDNAISLILPALPLEAGRTIALSVFSSGDGTTKVHTFKVGASESVTVPAGTFQAYRIEVSGGSAPAVMHVSTETPRRIVKIEVVGQPVAFELVR